MSMSDEVKPKTVPARTPKTNWVCEICVKDFKRYSSYFSHCRAKHSPPKIKCPHCDVRFSTIATRNSHYFRVKEPKAVVVRKQEEPVKKVSKKRKAPPEPVPVADVVVEPVESSDEEGELTPSDCDCDSTE